VGNAPALMDKLEDPFSEDGYQQYVAYWNEFVKTPDGRPSALTRLAEVIYKQRPDLQRHAPDVFEADLYWYLDWFLHSARREYGVDDALLTPIVVQRNRLLEIRQRFAHGKLQESASSTQEPHDVAAREEGVERLARMRAQLSTLPVHLALVLKE